MLREYPGLNQRKHPMILGVLDITIVLIMVELETGVTTEISLDCGIFLSLLPPRLLIQLHDVMIQVHKALRCQSADLRCLGERRRAESIQLLDLLLAECWHPRVIVYYVRRDPHALCLAPAFDVLLLPNDVGLVLHRCLDRIVHREGSWDHHRRRAVCRLTCEPHRRKFLGPRAGNI